jgi:hypothetical protein
MTTLSAKKDTPCRKLEFIKSPFQSARVYCGVSARYSGFSTKTRQQARAVHNLAHPALAMLGDWAARRALQG